MTEQWRPIPGASRYEASSHGRVRSVDRTIPLPLKSGRVAQRKHKGCVLRHNHGMTGGYASVVITLDNGDRLTKSVHILVCSTFHGERPAPGYEVRHLNGVRTDNRAENLAWGTRSENSYDTVQHGNNQWANKTHCPNGHPYSGENLLIEGERRARRCRACTNQRKRLQMRRARAQGSGWATEIEESN